MIHRLSWQRQIVIGVFALALASIAFQWLHQDFLGGLAFGVGLPLVLLGILAKRRLQESEPPHLSA